MRAWEGSKDVSKPLVFGYLSIESSKGVAGAVSECVDGCQGQDEGGRRSAVVRSLSLSPRRYFCVERKGE